MSYISHWGRTQSKINLGALLLDLANAEANPGHLNMGVQGMRIVLSCEQLHDLDSSHLPCRARACLRMHSSACACPLAHGLLARIWQRL